MWSHTIIIVISLFIILSYIFDSISNKIMVPSALFLILTGLALNQLSLFLACKITIPFQYLQLLGNIGLVLIVLEGSLELKLNKSKLKLIITYAIISLLLIILPSLTITTLLQFFWGATFLHALIYALPFSIISSAIVIPSIEKLKEQKKEFLTYDSILSDIIGILIFNVLLYYDETNWLTILHISLSSFLLISMCSIILSMAIIYILFMITGKNRILLILSIIMMLFSIGKLYHLPALILVLVFGLLLNNFKTIISKTRYWRNVTSQDILLTINQFKMINSQLTFFIRTLFFILFGFSINLNSLKIISFTAGGAILILIYLFRYLLLRFYIGPKIHPEIWIAPRGLVTVLLFYSIPPTYWIRNFEEGVLFLVIMATNLIMAAGLVLFLPEKK